MAYARFSDYDIYIYPHVGGWIECSACFLNEAVDEYSLFSVSEAIHDDETLLVHILQHRIMGHNIPEDLEYQILADPDRYGHKPKGKSNEYSTDELW
jgi:hypothetical protein